MPPAGGSVPVSRKGVPGAKRGPTEILKGVAGIKRGHTGIIKGVYRDSRHFQRMIIDRADLDQDSNYLKDVRERRVSVRS